MGDPLTFPQLVSKDRDQNAIDNPMFMQISDGVEIMEINADGSINVLLGANSGVDIGDVDVTSIIPGVGAANLGKAEDAVHSSGDVGVEMLAVRNDVLATLVDADGDYAPLQVDADGALYITGSLTVDFTYDYAEDSANTTGDIGAYVLAVRQDTLASSTSADGDYASFKVNAAGAMYVTTSGAASGDVHVDDTVFTVATDVVNASGFLADETTPDSVGEGDIGIARMTLDRKQLFVLADATTDSQRLAINASGEAQVDLAAHALTNTNALPVSANNTANAEANPIYVHNVNSVVSGSEIQDYDTSVSIASDASDNHDYTVVGTTFLLKSIIVSGAGNQKFELLVGPVAGLVAKATGFLTGRQGDTKQLFFDPPIEVPSTSTGTIRVIRTNRQGAAADVYSTIIGNDVA